MEGEVCCKPKRIAIKPWGDYPLEMRDDEELGIKGVRVRQNKKFITAEWRPKVPGFVA
jgi:hypothetical protein